MESDGMDSIPFHSIPFHSMFYTMPQKLHAEMEVSSSIQIGGLIYFFLNFILQNT